MFGAHAASFTIESRHFVFRYRSPAHWIGVFKTYYGPLLKTFAALAPAEQVALEHDVTELIAAFNRATHGTAVIPSEYLEIVIVTR
jgi:hypothetical protein